MCGGVFVSDNLIQNPYPTQPPHSIPLSFSSINLCCVYRALVENVVLMELQVKLSAHS